MINTVGDLVAFFIVMISLSTGFAAVLRLADRIRQDREGLARQRLSEECRHASRAEELERQRNAIAANDQETRERTAQHEMKLAERKLAVSERKIALKERAQERELNPPAVRPGASLKKEVPALPADLELRVMSWADAWARDHERRFILELYDDLVGDWDKVRKALAIKDASVEGIDLELVSG
jgi:hypothetical protein